MFEKSSWFPLAHDPLTKFDQACLQDLLLLCGLETLPLALASVALGPQNLHMRKGLHPLHPRLHPLALAAAAATNARWVQHLAGDRHLLRLALVNLLQGQVQRLHQALCFPPTIGTRQKEHVRERENVHPIRKHGLLSETVIASALLRITQNLVGAGDRSELLWVPAPVRVRLERHPLVRLFDIGLRRILIRVQECVELGGLHVLAASASALVLEAAGHGERISPNLESSKLASHTSRISRGNLHFRRANAFLGRSARLRLSSQPRATIGPWERVTTSTPVDISCAWTEQRVGASF